MHWLLRWSAALAALFYFYAVGSLFTWLQTQQPNNFASAVDPQSPRS